MFDRDRIVPINIEDEMKTAYIDYSMSVIVSRAIPDVRDGLKPVHRRVLFGMFDMGLYHNRPYKKSARIVGEVLGKYHPHGDSSVYDAMVRMAQPWSLRYPLVDGQGNFGSVDGDSPAAMRYTEARLQKIAEEMLADIDKDTVDYANNFDDSLQEPTVLPARIPNLLVNGSSGIAVGMATNILPHNLSEVIDGMKAYIDNRDITIEEIMQFIKAPDFPTGGTIWGYEGVKEGFETGRGKVVVRAKSDIEPGEHGARDKIIVTEIPYQVNKAQLIMKTAELVNEKKLEGIADIRDESDRTGMRIVYEVRKDAIPNVVLNRLYKYTQLQTSFGINNISLSKGRPALMNIKELLHEFVEFRHEVVVRRTEYDLAQAEKRAHILEGLLIALDHLDEIITLIRASKTPEEARNGLMSNFNLSEEQARAILDLRLQKLTGLERDKIKEEFKEIMEKITYYKELLGNEEMRYLVIKDELEAIKQQYGDERKTDIVFQGDEFSIEDMIPNEEVIITISHMGYIKRTVATDYKKQGRGGRGSRGSQTRDEDFIEDLFVASTHNYLLFFTELGKVYWLKVHQIPEGTKASKGRAIQNLINLPPDDKVRAFMTVPNLTDEELLNNNFVMFCTKKGVIKKTVLEAFSRPRENGIIAISINEGDMLLEAKLTDGDSDILMAAKSGRAIRFHEKHVRSMGRTATGVRGITLANATDEVVGMICVSRQSEQPDDVFVAAEHGYGKRTALEEYRETNRGGKGIKTMQITEKTGKLIAIKAVNEEHDLMIINKSGIAIRIGVEGVNRIGRATQGVKLIRLGDDDAIASVARIQIVDEDPEELLEGEDNITPDLPEDSIEE